MEQKKEAPRLSSGLHGFARLLVAATGVLIFAGALVTSTGSGLSVPDWPLSFGTLFPPMVGGVRFEHTHRLIAGSVALLTIFLAAWLFHSVRTPRIRLLAALAVGAVLLQALLGGATVLLGLPPAVSVAHGTLGQVFFALVVALALILSPAWSAARPEPADARALVLRTLSLATLVATAFQLVVGATMRHLHAGLAIPDFPLSFGSIVPPLDDVLVAVNFTHRATGVLVFVLALVTGWMALRHYRTHRPLWWAGARLIALVTLQGVLGAYVVWTQRSALITSLHVVNGALVLVTSLGLAMWAHRLFGLSEWRPADATFRMAEG